MAGRRSGRVPPAHQASRTISSIGRLLPAASWLVMSTVSIQIGWARPRNGRAGEEILAIEIADHRRRGRGGIGWNHGEGGAGAAEQGRARRGHAGA